jgi:hypothetical protein
MLISIPLLLCRQPGVEKAWFPGIPKRENVAQFAPRGLRGFWAGGTVSILLLGGTGPDPYASQLGRRATLRHYARGASEFSAQCAMLTVGDRMKTRPHVHCREGFSFRLAE